MFQFRRFPTYAYFVQRRLTEYCSAGFPHSEIHGSRPMCGSPWLIAACHVLRRFLMPRHSPCALFSLTSSGRTSYPSLPAIAESSLTPSPLLSKSGPLRLGPDLGGAARRFPRSPGSSPYSESIWFSKELCRHKSVHCSFCVTLLDSTKFTLLPLCCLLAISCLLHCSVFKVQVVGAKSVPLRPRLPARTPLRFFAPPLRFGPAPLGSKSSLAQGQIETLGRLPKRFDTSSWWRLPDSNR